MTGKKFLAMTVVVFFLAIAPGVFAQTLYQCSIQPDGSGCWKLVYYSDYDEECDDEYNKDVCWVNCPDSQCDSDQDNLTDNVDQCDTTDEDFDGCQDTDGCPEPPSACSIQPTTPPTSGCTDSDGDSVCDSTDQCDYTDEDFDNCQDYDGCPEPPSACPGTYPSPPTYTYPTPSGSILTYYICNSATKSCSATSTPTAGSYGTLNQCQAACNPPVATPVPVPPHATLTGPAFGSVGSVLHYSAVATGQNLDQLDIYIADINSPLTSGSSWELLATRGCQGTYCNLDVDWVPDQNDGGINYILAVNAYDENGLQCSGNPSRGSSWVDCDPSSDYIDVVISSAPNAEEPEIPEPEIPGTPPTATISGPNSGTVGDRLIFTILSSGPVDQVGVWRARVSSDLSNASSWTDLSSGQWVPNDLEVGDWVVVVNAFGSGGQCSGNLSRNPSIWTECSPGEEDLVRVNISAPIVTASGSQTCTPGQYLGPCKKEIGDEFCVNGTAGPQPQCIAQVQPTPTPPPQQVCNLGDTLGSCNEGLAYGLNRCIYDVASRTGVVRCMPTGCSNGGNPPECIEPEVEEVITAPVTQTEPNPEIESLATFINGNVGNIEGQEVISGSNIYFQVFVPASLTEYACRWNYGDGRGDVTEDCISEPGVYPPGDHTISVYVVNRAGQESQRRTISFKVKPLPSIESLEALVNGQKVNLAVGLTAPQKVTFVANVPSVLGDDFACRWDLGKGLGENSECSISEVFNTGTHSVSVVVLNNAGQQSESVGLTFSLKAPPPPPPPPPSAEVRCSASYACVLDEAGRFTGDANLHWTRVGDEFSGVNRDCPQQPPKTDWDEQLKGRILSLCPEGTTPGTYINQQQGFIGVERSFKDGATSEKAVNYLPQCTEEKDSRPKEGFDCSNSKRCFYTWVKNESTSCTFVPVYNKEGPFAGKNYECIDAPECSGRGEGYSTETSVSGCLPDSTEEEFDCKAGYKWFYKYKRDNSTGCQWVADSPNYRVVKDVSCGVASDEALLSGLAISCDPTQPDSCQKGYYCEPTQKICLQNASATQSEVASGGSPGIWTQIVGGTFGILGQIKDGVGALKDGLGGIRDVSNACSLFLDENPEYKYSDIPFPADHPCITAKLIRPSDFGGAIAATINNATTAWNGYLNDNRRYIEEENARFASAECQAFLDQDNNRFVFTGSPNGQSFVRGLIPRLVNTPCGVPTPEILANEALETWQRESAQTYETYPDNSPASQLARRKALRTNLDSALSKLGVDLNDKSPDSLIAQIKKDETLHGLEMVGCNLDNLMNCSDSQVETLVKVVANFDPGKRVASLLIPVEAVQNFGLAEDTCQGVYGVGCFLSTGRLEAFYGMSPEDLEKLNHIIRARLPEVSLVDFDLVKRYVEAFGAQVTDPGVLNDPVRIRARANLLGVTEPQLDQIEKSYQAYLRAGQIVQTETIEGKVQGNYQSIANLEGLISAAGIIDPSWIAGGVGIGRVILKDTVMVSLRNRLGKEAGERTAVLAERALGRLQNRYAIDGAMEAALREVELASRLNYKVVAETIAEKGARSEEFRKFISQYVADKEQIPTIQRVLEETYLGAAELGVAGGPQAQMEFRGLVSQEIINWNTVERALNEFAVQNGQYLNASHIVTTVATAQTPDEAARIIVSASREYNLPEDLVRSLSGLYDKSVESRETLDILVGRVERGELPARPDPVTPEELVTRIAQNGGVQDPSTIYTQYWTGDTENPILLRQAIDFASDAAAHLRDDIPPVPSVVITEPGQADFAGAGIGELAREVRDDVAAGFRNLFERGARQADQVDDVVPNLTNVVLKDAADDAADQGDSVVTLSAGDKARVGGSVADTLDNLSLGVTDAKLSPVEHNVNTFRRLLAGPTDDPEQVLILDREGRVFLPGDDEVPPNGRNSLVRVTTDDNGERIIGDVSTPQGANISNKIIADSLEVVQPDAPTPQVKSTNRNALEERIAKVRANNPLEDGFGSDNVTPEALNISAPAAPASPPNNIIDDLTSRIDSILRRGDESLVASPSTVDDELAKLTRIREAINRGEVTPEVQEFWTGIVRDADGSLKGYQGKVKDSYYKGPQSEPDLTSEGTMKYIQANLDSREAFLQGMQEGKFNGTVDDFIDWIESLHQKHAYKGDQLPGQLRHTNAMSPGSHTPFAEGDVMTAAERFNDPYIHLIRNKEPFAGYKLELPGIPEADLISTSLPTDYYTQKGIHIAHQYPDPQYFDDYFKVMQDRLTRLQEIGISAPVDEQLRLIADFYQYAINARPFDEVNNSLFMNMVNGLLTERGLAPISHGYLDFAAMRLQPDNFARLFQEEVEKASRRVPCLVSFNIIPTAYAQGIASPCKEQGVLEKVQDWIDDTFLEGKQPRPETIVPEEVVAPQPLAAEVEQAKWREAKVQLGPLLESYKQKEIDLPTLVQNVENIADVRAPPDKISEAALLVDDKFITTRAIAGDSGLERLFGDESWVDWLNARVTAKAHGDEPLTVDFIKELHIELTRATDVQRVAQGKKEIGGKIRTTGVTGGDYTDTSKPIKYTQEQADAIRNNPFLALQQEGPDPNTGKIVYPSSTYSPGRKALESLPPELIAKLGPNPSDSQLVEALLEDLVNWYNKQILDSNHDPYELAAELQRRLISIHPFGDVNGRVSRALMDWSLEKEGNAAARLFEPSNDIITSSSEWAAQVKAGSDRHQFLIDRAAALEKAGIKVDPAILLGVEEEAAYYKYTYSQIARAPPPVTPGEGLVHPEYERFLVGLRENLQGFNNNYSGNRPFSNINTPIGGIIPDSVIDLLTATPKDFEAYEVLLRDNYFTNLPIYRGAVSTDAIKTEADVLKLFENYTAIGSSYEADAASFISPLSTRSVPSQKIKQALERYNQLISNDDLGRPDNLLEQITTHANKPDEAHRSPFASASVAEWVSNGWAQNPVSIVGELRARIKDSVLFRARPTVKGAIPTFQEDSFQVGLNAYAGKSLTNYAAEREILIPGGLHPASIDAITVYKWGEVIPGREGLPGTFGVVNTAFEAEKLVNDDGVFVLVKNSKTGEKTGYKLNPESGKYEPTTYSVSDKLDTQSGGVIVRSMAEAVYKANDLTTLNNNLYNFGETSQGIKQQDVILAINGYAEGYGSIYTIPKEGGIRDQVKAIVEAWRQENWTSYFLKIYLDKEITKTLTKAKYGDIFEKTIKAYLTPDGYVTGSRLQAPPGSYRADITIKLNTFFNKAEVTDIKLTEGMSQEAMDNIRKTITKELNFLATSPTVSTVPRKTTLLDRYADGIWKFGDWGDERAYHFRKSVGNVTGYLNPTDIQWWAYNNIGFYKAYINWFDKQIYNTHK